MDVRPSFPTVGVEEEYQLVDENTGHLHADCRDVLGEVLRQQPAGDNVIYQHELHLSQIEAATGICQNMQQVREQLSSARRLIHQAARSYGNLLVSAGTNPLPIAPDEADDVTPKPRYETMLHRYRQLVKELRIFGCHVHVGIPDLETGVQILNYARLYLPLLQALSANSPFWEGQDTGYASYRRELWIQWPMAGPPQWFRDANDYQTLVEQLVVAGAIEEPTRIYWDARLPQKTPTIEFRVFDAQTDVQLTVALAAICRAIVVTASEEIRQGQRAPQVRHELMSAAMWQSARFGMSDLLICPMAGRPLPAQKLLDDLIARIRPALEAGKDWNDPDGGRVESFLQGIRSQGTGAQRQRQWGKGLLDLVHNLHQRTIRVDTEL